MDNLIGKKCEYSVTSAGQDTVRVIDVIKNSWVYEGITFCSFENSNNVVNSIICKVEEDTIISEAVEKAIAGDTDSPSTGESNA